jgi:hypothetical protein
VGGQPKTPIVASLVYEHIKLVRPLVDEKSLNLVVFSILSRAMSRHEVIPHVIYLLSSHCFSSTCDYAMPAPSIAVGKKELVGCEFLQTITLIWTISP